MQNRFLGLPSPQIMIPWALVGVRVVLTLALAWLLSVVAKRLLRRLRLYAIQAMDRRGDMSDVDLEKRAATIMAVLFTVIRWLIWLVAWVMVMLEMGFRIEPLLAGLSVAGLSLGLGAQNLIKDWLAGLFLLLEDQLRIGDLVTINNINGTVEEINLRTTVLRAENGAVHVVPNGAIATLANMSRDYSFFVFEATIAYKSDAQKAIQILTEVAEQVSKDPRFSKDVLAPMEVEGIERIGDQGAVVKGRMKTLPARQFTVGREINGLVLQRFDVEGVAFPEPRAR
jgi:moderate conductance mechanosensitive channel